MSCTQGSGLVKGMKPQTSGCAVTVARRGALYQAQTGLLWKLIHEMTGCVTMPHGMLFSTRPSLPLAARARGKIEACLLRIMSLYSVNALYIRLLSDKIIALIRRDHCW